MSRALHSLEFDEIARLCLDAFGATVTPRRFLSGEIAVNVVVDAVPGVAQPESGVEPGTYVLKAEYASATMTPAHADWFCRIQATAARAGLPVARQLPAEHAYVGEDGESSGYVALVPIPGSDEPAMLRLQEYLDGQVAADAPTASDYASQVGRLTAHLVAALADAPAEPDPILHPWSFETTGRNVQFSADRINTLESSGMVPEDLGTRLSADVALARQVARAFDSQVLPELAGLPTQVVHQDINDANVLLAGSGPNAGTISGIIDFGDCRTAPRVAELAIAAAYTMLGESDPLAALQACVDAYAEAAAGTAAQLSERELGLVTTSAVARLCLNACTWSARTLAAGLDSPQAQYGRARLARTWPVVRELGPQILKTARA